MLLTITVGWWVLPVLISLGVIIWVLTLRDNSAGSFSPDLEGGFKALIGVIVIILSWLIWALFKLFL